MHYAGRDKANESTMTETWYQTLCGIEYAENVTDNIDEVTCKKCINKIKIIDSKE